MASQKKRPTCNYSMYPCHDSSILVSVSTKKREVDMLIGQSVIAPSGGAPAILYTPWFPRGGNGLRASVQYLNKSGALSTFSCTVLTKNNEDSDASESTLGSSFSISSSTLGEVTTSSTFTGCKELVRYSISVMASSGTEWVHFEINSPIWLPN